MSDFAEEKEKEAKDDAASAAPSADESDFHERKSDGEESDKPIPDWVPSGGRLLADGSYDAIILGTGLKECVMSGLLSTMGMKVLHLDRNNFYGSECASLNLTTLYKKFGAGTPPAYLGANRDYNVDLIPKFILACGNLTKMLLHTKVTKYLEFKSIDGSFVYKGKQVLKVPATPDEALRSSLMGIFEKRRFRSFVIFVNQYVPANPATHQGLDLTRLTMKELYKHFGLVEETWEFVSHAMCLETSDEHMSKPAMPTVMNLQTYCYSLERYGKSPYIYPMYGLGGLPEGFSRLCAIHGGTFMLNQDVDEILFDKDGAAWGVRAGDRYAKATMVLGEASYFPPEKVRSTGKVVRSVCFLNHPHPNTNNAESCQIIIPGNQVGRKNDVFVCCVSAQQNVAAKGVYVAIASTSVETSNPAAELNAGLALMGTILQRFDSVSECYEPVGDGTADRCFISSSFDGSSHFENDCTDLLSLYERVTGQKLDMNINADSVEAEADY